MPEVRFEEQEPVRIDSASCSTTETPLRLDESTKVRYGEWRGEGGETYAILQPQQTRLNVRNCVMQTFNWLVILMFANAARSHVGGKAPPLWLLASFGILAIEIVLLSIWEMRDKRNRRQLRNLMPEEESCANPWRPDLRGAEVDAVFLQNGCLYGRDHGFFQLEGGSVFFEGARTSFSIATSRLRRVPKQRAWRRAFQLTALEPSQEALTYEFDGVKYWFGLTSSRKDAQVETMIRHWLSQPPEPAEYEVLLPKAIQPEARKEVLAPLILTACAVQTLALMTAIVVSSFLSTHGKYPVGTADILLWLFYGLLGVIQIGVIVKTVVQTLRRRRFFATHPD